MSLMPRLQRPGATNYTNVSPLQQTLAHVGRRKEGRGGGEKIPLLFSLRASSPYGRVARSHASTAREMRRKCQGWGKKFLLCHLIRIVLKPNIVFFKRISHPSTNLRTQTYFRSSARSFQPKFRKVTFRVRRPEIRQRKSSAEIVSVLRLSVHTQPVFLKKPLSRVVLARPRTHESGQEPMTSLGLLIRFNKSQKCGYRNVRTRVHGV